MKTSNFYASSNPFSIGRLLQARYNRLSVRIALESLLKNYPSI